MQSYGGEILVQDEDKAKSTEYGSKFNMFCKTVFFLF